MTCSNYSFVSSLNEDTYGIIHLMEKENVSWSSLSFMILNRLDDFMSGESSGKNHLRKTTASLETIANR